MDAYIIHFVQSARVGETPAGMFCLVNLRMILIITLMKKADQTFYTFITAGPACDYRTISEGFKYY